MRVQSAWRLNSRKVEAKSDVLIWIDSHSTIVGQSSGHSHQHTHVEHSLRPFLHNSFPKSALFTLLGVKYPLCAHAASVLLTLFLLDIHLGPTTPNVNVTTYDGCRLVGFTAVLYHRSSLNWWYQCFADLLHFEGAACQCRFAK